MTPRPVMQLQQPVQPRADADGICAGGQTVSGESGRVASVFRIGSFRGGTAGLSQDRLLIRHNRERYGISRGTNPASKVKHDGGAPKSASGDVDDEVCSGMDEIARRGLDR